MILREKRRLVFYVKSTPCRGTLSLSLFSTPHHHLDASSPCDAPAAGTYPCTSRLNTAPMLVLEVSYHVYPACRIPGAAILEYLQYLQDQASILLVLHLRSLRLVLWICLVCFVLKSTCWHVTKGRNSSTLQIISMYYADSHENSGVLFYGCGLVWLDY